ncbi:MAG: ATP-dependent Clp protease proteolytic subunit [Clostridia bacterium]|nr:ATP-dependent Clp protease proteolytic subunit [Clostridia bacterium]
MNDNNNEILNSINENELQETAGDADKNAALKGDGEAIHALIIAGQIEGHYAAPADTKSTKYEQLIPTLVAVEESREIGGLLILLNTIGGDVEAGLAIAELISGMKKPTVSLVLGGSHSIGVPLAVSAKRSFIVPSATMTLHPVRINGLVIGVHQSFVYFEKMQERIIDFIVRNSKADKEELRKLIMKTDEMTTDIGSVLEGNEAVEKGLIDSVGSLSDALIALRSMINGGK